jgi:hypothetical protein
MIYWPAVVGAMQRRRWAARLERAAPERLTVAAAADLLQLERARFLEFLRSRVGLAVGLDSEVSRDSLVEALRGKGPSPLRGG